MKKVFGLLILFSLTILGVQKAFAITFEEAIAQPKPMAVLIYADWADDAAGTVQAYNAMSQSYGDKYNFTTLNIASKETKAFNKMYHIYPNLPYVLLFKDRGKISRYLKKDCVMNSACFKEKLDFFTNN